MIQSLPRQPRDARPVNHFPIQILPDLVVFLQDLLSHRFLGICRHPNGQVRLALGGENNPSRRRPK